MIAHTLTEDLNKFREAYHSVKCTVFSDVIIYKCAYGKAIDAAKSANDLIIKLDLPLVAIPNRFPNNNSYTIQSQETSDL